MDNQKSELLETVETVSEFAGTLAGRVVVRSREIVDCIKNLATATLEPKPEPSTESTKSQAKKNHAEVEKKKMATSKQARLKKKMDTPESSGTRRGRSRPKAGSGENAAVEGQKPEQPVTKSKKSSVKSSRSAAKN